MKNKSLPLLSLLFLAITMQSLSAAGDPNQGIRSFLTKRIHRTGTYAMELLVSTLFQQIGFGGEFNSLLTNGLLYNVLQPCGKKLISAGKTATNKVTSTTRSAGVLVVSTARNTNDLVHRTTCRTAQGFLFAGQTMAHYAPLLGNRVGNEVARITYPIRHPIENFVSCATRLGDGIGEFNASIIRRTTTELGNSIKTLSATTQTQLKNVLTDIETLTTKAIDNLGTATAKFSKDNAKGLADGADHLSNAGAKSILKIGCASIAVVGTAALLYCVQKYGVYKIREYLNKCPLQDKQEIEKTLAMHLVKFCHSNKKNPVTIADEAQASLPLYAEILVGQSPLFIKNLAELIINKARNTQNKTLTHEIVCQEIANALKV